VTTPRDRARYAERYVVPWWAWLAGLALGVMLAGEFDLAGATLVGWAPYPLILVLVFGGLWWIGRVRVAVTGSELRVDDARLPLSCVAEVQRIGPATKRRLLSVDAHPLAFVVQRPWIRDTVRVVLDDPADPTPYWLISSRHPDRLIAALAADRTPAPDPAPQKHDQPQT
jgi:Protein of unknown function (DUF3093)